MNSQLWSKRNLQVTTENLAAMLEVNPDTIRNWASNIGLDIKTGDSDIESYSEELIILFREVRALILNGYSFTEIKEFLSLEIEYQNKFTQSIEEIIVEDAVESKNEKSKDHFKDTVSLVNEFNYSREYHPPEEDLCGTFKNVMHSNLTEQSNIAILFDNLMKEIKQYSERAMEAEKQVFLLEDYEKRSKQENSKLNEEIQQLKIQIEEKDQKLKDYEEQKKRLNLMEIQLKIMQFESNKKKFWNFLK